MKSIFSVLILLALAGCASDPQEREIQDEAVKQSSVSDGKALGNTIHDEIQNSKTLNDEQKKQLTQIIESNKQLATTLSEESFRFRAVLIKELLSGKVDQKKIQLIKNDIKEIEAKRLKNTFDTVEKITDIVSKHPEKEKYVDHLINMDRNSR